MLENSIDVNFGVAVALDFVQFKLREILKMRNSRGLLVNSPADNYFLRFGEFGLGRGGAQLE